jgi:tripartite-type tricarboxylate transporter receptor subunit TctC
MSAQYSGVNTLGVQASGQGGAVHRRAQQARLRRRLACAIGALVVGHVFTGTALAQVNTTAAEAFYKGKTITILVPANPGATFDLISRAMAPYLEKYTGASAQIQNNRVIEAQNKLASSRPDGLTVVLSGHGPKEITASLFKQPGVSFDWKTFTLLGRIPLSSTAIVVDKKLGWNNPGDLVGKKFLVGASAPFFEPLAAEALGWDGMRIIPGMSGSERTLGIRRGEIQGTSAGAAQVERDSDVLQPLVVSTRDEGGFKGIPTIEQVAIKGKEKWGRWAATWDQLMYWSYATPGIPQDRAKFLEQALAKTSKDPAFIAAMAKLKVHLSPEFVTADQLKAITRNITDLSESDIKEMEFAIEQKYVKQ